MASSFIIVLIKEENEIIQPIKTFMILWLPLINTNHPNIQYGSALLIYHKLRL